MRAAWRADTDSGRSSVLIAATTDTVRTLNERARSDLVAAGIVDNKHNLVLHDGLLVGRGDHILTRRIDRDLPDGTSTTTSGSRTRGTGSCATGNGGESTASDATAPSSSGFSTTAAALARPRSPCPGVCARARGAGVRDHRAPRPGHHRGHRARPGRHLDDTGSVLRRHDPWPTRQPRLPRPRPFAARTAGCRRPGRRPGPAHRWRSSHRDRNQHRRRTVSARSHSRRAGPRRIHRDSRRRSRNNREPRPSHRHRRAPHRGIGRHAFGAAGDPVRRLPARRHRGPRPACSWCRTRKKPFVSPAAACRPAAR